MRKKRKRAKIGKSWKKKQNGEQMTPIHDSIAGLMHSCLRASLSLDLLSPSPLHCILSSGSSPNATYAMAGLDFICRSMKGSMNVSVLAQYLCRDDRERHVSDDEEENRRSKQKRKGGSSGGRDAKRSRR
jgi:hypothetical protein